MDTVIIIGVLLFVLVVVIYSTGYMFELILYPEKVAEEYWNEYWGRDGADGEDKTTRQEV